jgi:hypothetical protein
VLEKIERKERVGASWRDLESAHVKARMEELLYVDSVNEDSSVGEFLDPNNWKMTAVRLPYDHVLGRKLLVARIEGEWITLPYLGMDGD